MSGLFQLGNFILNSGLKSQFKIDCDALTDKDIECLAFLIQCRTLKYDKVYGIPSGGLRIAKALEKYCSTDRTNRILIVDDVLTTGSSMYKACLEKLNNGWSAVEGAVIFARQDCPIWITPLFLMTEENK